MKTKTEYKKIQPYTTKDGSLVRELMPRDIHGNVFIHPGLPAALDHELMTEGLGPNRVSHTNDSYPIIHDRHCESKRLFSRIVFSEQASPAPALMPGTRTDTGLDSNGYPNPLILDLDQKTR